MKGVLKLTMHDKRRRYKAPRTIDDAADLLIGDLTEKDRMTMARMPEKDFFRLYRSVAEYILDDFELWTGNQALLDSCLSTAAEDGFSGEPAMIILKRVREKLVRTPTLVIIT